MSTPATKQPVTLAEVWASEDADVFAGALREYLYHKASKRKLPLST